MKRSREPKKPATVFGRYVGLVAQIREDNFCDRAIWVLKRFIQNEDLYLDTMATFFVQNKVNHQFQRLLARQPISDSELLHAYHHYTESTFYHLLTLYRR